MICQQKFTKITSTQQVDLWITIISSPPHSRTFSQRLSDIIRVYERFISENFRRDAGEQKKNHFGDFKRKEMLEIKFDLIKIIKWFFEEK
jgi:hypothetical protein